MVVLHLLIARADFRTQLLGCSNFSRLYILSSMHMNQVSIIYFVCSIYFDNVLPNYVKSSIKVCLLVT